MASNAKALSFLSGDLSLSGTEVSINVAGSVQSDSITGSTITMKNTGSTIVASDGTTAVLSESGGTVTLTADTAVIEGSSSGDLVRITQTGSGNALVVEDSTNPDSTPFVVDASGKVGIGTNSPYDPLSVHGTGTAYGSGYIVARVMDSSGNKGVFLGYDADENGGTIGGAGLLTFQTYGPPWDERMRIDNNGKVGIGTNSPSSYYANHLVVDIGSSVQSGITIVSDTGNQGMFAFADGTSGNARYRGAIDYNHSNDSMAFLAAGAEAMRIDSSGKVGIGTNSPSGSLAAGGLHVTDRIAVGGGSVGTPSLHTTNDTNTGIFFPAQDALGFSTGATERMRIDSSGNVGVGPSNLASLWKGNLNIAQPAGTKTELYFLRDTQVEAHIGFLGSNTDSSFYVGTGSALGSYGLYQLNTGNSWISVSDERQKTNLIPIVDAINKIKQLRTVTGRFLTDEDGISRSFLIAQDFVNNFPEAVDTNNPEKYGLSYTDVIPLIVAGFKEQQTLIESQQSQIDALTAKTQEQDFTIASLISRIEALENA